MAFPQTWGIDSFVPDGWTRINRKGRPAFASTRYTDTNGRPVTFEAAAPFLGWLHFTGPLPDQKQLRGKEASEAYHNRGNSPIPPDYEQPFIIDDSNTDPQKLFDEVEKYCIEAVKQNYMIRLPETVEAPADPEQAGH